MIPVSAKEWEGYEAVANLLLEFRADPDAVDREGRAFDPRFQHALDIPQKMRSKRRQRHATATSSTPTASTACFYNATSARLLHRYTSRKRSTALLLIITATKTAATSTTTWGVSLELVATYNWVENLPMPEVACVRPLS